MAWHFALWDLSGNRIGEVQNASERKWSSALGGLDNASFTISLANPLAREITSRSGDVLLSVYRGTSTTPVFTGDLVTAEETSDGDSGPSLACNFAGPLWRLSKRITGASTTGEGASYASQPRGAILQDVLTGLNTIHDTGIRVGTIASLLPMAAGPWIFKPSSEVFTEMAQSFGGPKFQKFTIFSTYNSQDSFTASSTVALNGYTSSSGHVWSTFGGVPGDFNADAVLDYCDRTGVDVADEYNGRFGVLGPSMTNTLVEVATARDGTFGSPPTLQGVLARSDGTTANYVRATVTTLAEGSQYLRVTKRVATGTPVDLWRSPVGTAMAIGVYNTMRLVIDDAGRWALWYWVTNDLFDPANLIASGQDDQLKAGGPLASGKAGIYDYNPGPATPTRGYDNFLSYVPSSSDLDTQPLEFELAPTAPTVDGSGVQIATLNVSTRVGTDRPSVVFESGGGNRAIRSWKHVYDKTDLMNHGFVLPSDATPWPAGALVEVSDPVTAAARGLYEDVISTDLGIGGAGAIASLHLYFRKQAKQTIEFAPSSTGPQFGTDYFIGDTVTARGSFQGSSLFNGTFRIYGVNLEIDNEGKETVTPTLALT